MYPGRNMFRERSLREGITCVVIRCVLRVMVILKGCGLSVLGWCVYGQIWGVAGVCYQRDCERVTIV